ncbi:MAG: hypothetical protein ACREQ5_40270 [Candidatus Dormibacteria bacterium]
MGTASRSTTSPADGSWRRGTLSAEDLWTACREADAIARDGKRAEVHYVAENGTRERLKECRPR